MPYSTSSGETIQSQDCWLWDSTFCDRPGWYRAKTCTLNDHGCRRICTIDDTPCGNVNGEYYRVFNSGVTSISNSNLVNSGVINSLTLTVRSNWWWWWWWWWTGAAAGWATSPTVTLNNIGLRNDELCVASLP